MESPKFTGINPLALLIALFKIYYALHSKIDFVMVILLNLNKIDIAAFTETKPKNCSNEYFCVNTNLKGYNCLSNYDGRGVCLYINDSFEVLQRLSDIEAIFKPSIFCRVKSQSSEVFTIGVVYRSPNSSVDDNNNINVQIDKVSKKLMKT